MVGSYRGAARPDPRTGGVLQHGRAARGRRRLGRSRCGRRLGGLTVPDGVNLADLTAATVTPLVLEEGGTAKVSQVTYAGRPYIFKCYFDELRDTVRPAELQKMLDWHDRRPAADRAWLNVGAAWVRHLVWDGELFTGVLLPQAAPDFIA